MSDTENTKIIEIADDVDREDLFGNLDCNLRMIEEATKSEIIQRGSSLVIKGGDSELASGIVHELSAILEKGETLDEQKVRYAIGLRAEGKSYAGSNVGGDIICFTTKGRPIRPKTLGQKNYVDQIRKKMIVFGTGPNLSSASSTISPISSSVSICDILLYISSFRYSFRTYSSGINASTGISTEVSKSSSTFSPIFVRIA